MAIGEFMSSVILVVFYYTIFAVFALPLSVIKNPFKLITENSNFQLQSRVIGSRADFIDES